MGQALYRKYRPRSLEEVIGQDHITRTLTRALAEEHISHAYLFTGPRGTGKTSAARILAYAVNGLTYDDNGSQLDIIEIDAASNRRIDEIRELRDRVNIAPTSAKYKVYIIDEVHMLTREAFNALLKTLEEPPAHVIFMLATTEAHKLPETIISRTQRFTFHPVALDKVTSHLRNIAKTEKIKIDDDALELIAQHGEGSFRDSISLLDQARTMAPHITRNEVRGMLGLASEEGVAELTCQVETGKTTEVVQSLQQLREQGLEAAQVAKQLSQTWRSRLLARSDTLPATTLLPLLEQLLRVPSVDDPFALLEIILLETAFSKLPLAPTPPRTASAPAEPAAVTATPLAESPKLVANVTATTATAPFDTTLWSQLLSTIKQSHNTLYGIVRMAQPRFSDDQLVLDFQFAFHQKRVNDARNKKIIAGVVQELTGRTIRVICELVPNTTQTVATTATDEETTTDPSLQAISNIFGGAELLESEN